MKTAIFKNHSDEPFTGGYDGRTKTFAPGQEVYMPAYLAAHLAKHLANRELIKLGKITATSPKKPEEVPDFMEMFNRGFIPDNSPEDEFGSSDDPKNLDALIKSANMNKVKAPLPEGAQHLEGKKSQDLPEIDLNEGEDESEFKDVNKS